MCDFVCERRSSNWTNCLLIRSGSGLERVKGIEPSFSNAARRRIRSGREKDGCKQLPLSAISFFQLASFPPNSRAHPLSS